MAKTLMICVASALLSAASAAVAIAGLSAPTSFTYDNNGHVYITEKSGILKMATSFNATAATVLLDMENQVANYGDHGLTSVAYADNYLYITYSSNNTDFGDSCTDNGDPNGRPDGDINGCKVIGRLSRFPIDTTNGTITGPEEVLIGETSAKQVCAQFFTGPIDRVLSGSDGFLYMTAGAGYNTFTIDYGQLGTDPCAVGGSQWGGAFRSQDLGSLDGKVIRYDPATGDITIIARGLNNPWRFTINNNQLYLGDTGLNMYEEINGPIDLTGNNTGVDNFGFPCKESGNNISDYTNLNSSVCADAAADPRLRSPLFAYGAPNNNTRTSVSAIAVYNGRIYYGDYSQSSIFSIAMDGTGMRTERKPVWPVDMAVVPGYGLVYADIVARSIKSFTPGAPSPSPSGGAAAQGVSAAAVTVMLAAFMLHLARD